MPKIIDFHTHIFPDHVAENAIPLLEKEGDVQAFLNGTKTDLLLSMDRAGISESVVCFIATKTSQFEAIIDFSNQIRSARLHPFPSVHPDDPDAVTKIRQIKEEGFKGIKMHPYYQNFYMSDQQLMPIYSEIAEQNLVLLMHTGFDVAFPEERRADPAEILKVHNHFPDLKLVTSHFGAWNLWDEVDLQLIGKDIYMDLSFALQFLEPQKARKMIENHPEEYILFGTDSPWADQHAEIDLLNNISLSNDLTSKILGKNAHNLLHG